MNKATSWIATGLLLSAFNCMAADNMKRQAPVADGQDATSIPAGDPQRWYEPDTTPQQRYRTAQTEAASALRDALQECQSMKGTEARSCKKEAQDNYRNDMQLAKQQLSEKAEKSSRSD